MEFSTRAWSVTTRNRFITVLTQTGDPSKSAAAIGQSLAAV